MIDRNELRENLSKCIAEITFQKADGTIREMTCTLMEDYVVSPEKPTEPHVPRKQNDEVLAVWDMDKNARRSFRLDSLNNIRYLGVNRV